MPDFVDSPWEALASLRRGWEIAGGGGEGGKSRRRRKQETGIGMQNLKRLLLN